jgi:hypothetical protein
MTTEQAERTAEDVVREIEELLAEVLSWIPGGEVVTS